MDKILAKLKEANISEEDLNELKESFEAAVKTRVDEASKTIAEKADEYCRQKIDSAVNLKTAQLESLANSYCEKKAATIARKADRKIAEQTAKLEKLTQQYIVEYFDEKFQEKYGEELHAIEESVITNLDKYFEYAINEKISPALITKTAVNETLAPLVKGIQNLFEEQYVPLNVSGSKKLKEANRRCAELEATLKESYDENIRISEDAQKAAKRALIAEKTVDLSAEQREKVKKFFESKSYSTVKEDIDTYCEVITENAKDLPITRNTMLQEKRVTALRRRPSIEDGTTEFVTEKFKPVNESTIDDFLTRSSKYLED